MSTTERAFTRENLIAFLVKTSETAKNWTAEQYIDQLGSVVGAQFGVKLDRTERESIVREALPNLENSLYRESEQSQNSQETRPEQFAAPIRKEDWIESADYPGIWINSSGEIMDGATRKVRTL